MCGHFGRNQAIVFEKSTLPRFRQEKEDIDNLDSLPQQPTERQYVSVLLSHNGLAAHALKEGGARCR